MTQKSFIGHYASRNLFFMHLIYFINIRTTSAAKERLRNQKLFLQILFVIGLHQIITGSFCEILLKQVFGEIGTGLTCKILLFKDTIFS